MTDMNMIKLSSDTGQKVSEIIAGIADGVQITPERVAVLTLSDKDRVSTLLSEADVAVADYELRQLVDPSVRLVTFSRNNTSADVTSLNLQQRETCRSFEVLSGSSMGRVYVPYSCNYSMDQILIAVAVMCALGAALDDILTSLNGFLK